MSVGGNEAAQHRENCLQVNECEFRSRRAWKLHGEILSLVITQGGGHFAELRLRNDNCPNLLWQPPWPTIEPGAYLEHQHAALYGVGAEARLLSGILGHNLCFPFWGDPSAAECAAGALYHGEAADANWTAQVVSDSLLLEATFSQSLIRMRRQITCHGNRIQVRSTAENLSMWDRPVGWCEHVTFGPPFLNADATVFEASLGEGFVTGQEDGAALHWPNGRGAVAFDLRRYASEPHSDLMNSFAVLDGEGEGFFRATNEELRINVTYRFPVSDFRWLNVWENNDGRMQTRAMEFSNTPRHGTMRTLSKSTDVRGVPAYDWLGGRGTLQKQFTIEVKRG